MMRNLCDKMFLLNCVQDDHHRVGVVSAVAPLPSCHVHCLSFHHHTHRVQTSTRPDVYAQVELEHPVGEVRACVRKVPSQMFAEHCALHVMNDIRTQCVMHFACTGTQNLPRHVRLPNAHFFVDSITLKWSPQELFSR